MPQGAAAARAAPGLALRPRCSALKMNLFAVK